jgi:hypothetical protein
MFKVFEFPNGFHKQAEDIHDWLRHYNFTPKFEFDGGTTFITLPTQEDVDMLVLLAKYHPARWGNHENILKLIGREP